MTRTTVNLETAQSRMNGRGHGIEVARFHPNGPLQYGPILQRHFPTANACRHGHECGAIPACRDCASCMRAGCKIRRKFKDIMQDRTQPYAGMRRPLTLGQEFGPVRASGQKRGSNVSRRPARHLRTGTGGRLSHRAESPAKGFAEKVARRDRGHHRPALHHAHQQVRGVGRRMTRWSMFSGALKTVAGSWFKIANDMRPALGSGPVSGLGRADLAGKRARIVHHARQGQPDTG